MRKLAYRTASLLRNCGSLRVRMRLGMGSRVSTAGIKVRENTIATITPKAVNRPRSPTEVTLEVFNARKPNAVVMEVTATGALSSFITFMTVDWGVPLVRARSK